MDGDLHDFLLFTTTAKITETALQNKKYTQKRIAKECAFLVLLHALKGIRFAHRVVSAGCIINRQSTGASEAT